MPDDLQLEIQSLATQLLSSHGGYDWLLEGKAFWSVNEVVRALEGEGVRISNDTIARWFKTLEHTQDFGGPVGLRASRNDLIVMFAVQMQSPLLDELLEQQHDFLEMMREAIKSERAKDSGDQSAGDQGSAQAG